jgi:hypothetical protein
MKAKPESSKLMAARAPLVVTMASLASCSITALAGLLWQGEGA